MVVRKRLKTGYIPLFNILDLDHALLQSKIQSNLNKRLDLDLQFY